MSEIFLRATRTEVLILLEGFRKLIETEPEDLRPGLRRAVEILELRMKYVSGGVLDPSPLFHPPEQ